MSLQDANLMNFDGRFISLQDAEMRKTSRTKSGEEHDSTNNDIALAEALLYEDFGFEIMRHDSRSHEATELPKAAKKWFQATAGTSEKVYPAIEPFLLEWDAYSSKNAIPYKCGELIQMVIPKGDYQGNWVDCRVSAVNTDNTYDVHVCETTKYDNAMGRSKQLVMRLPDECLRQKPKSKFLFDKDVPENWGDIVGKRIHVQWLARSGGGHEWFWGTITNYSETRGGGEHHIVYDDGDERWYSLPKKTFRLQGENVLYHSEKKCNLVCCDFADSTAVELSKQSPTLVVSGAGSQDVNGTYVKVSTDEGTGLSLGVWNKKTVNGCYQIRNVFEASAKQWVIECKPEGRRFYVAKAVHTNPPHVGWSKKACEGLGSVPTVTLGDSEAAAALAVEASAQSDSDEQPPQQQTLSQRILSHHHDHAG